MSGGDRRRDEAPPRRLSIAAAKPELRRLASWLHDLAREEGLPKGVAFALDLASHEAVANVISYAFEDAEEHEVVVRFRRRADRVELEVEDDGRAFDPLTVAPGLPLVSLERSEVGGRGIHLMRQFMDEVTYRREGGRNVLTLRKRLPSTAIE